MYSPTDVSKELPDKENTNIVETIIKTMGNPRNYGPTREELDEKEKLETEKKLKKEQEEREERERREAEETALRQQREMEWVSERIDYSLKILIADDMGLYDRAPSWVLQPTAIL